MNFNHHLLEWKTVSESLSLYFSLSLSLSYLSLEKKKADFITHAFLFYLFFPFLFLPLLFYLAGDNVQGVSAL